MPFTLKDTIKFRFMLVLHEESCESSTVSTHQPLAEAKLWSRKHTISATLR